MDYLGVVKKSYELTLKHKFLWIFGFFAGVGGIGFFKFYPSFFNFGSSDITTSSNQNITSPDLGVVFVIAVIILIIVGFLISAILSYTSQGALIAEFATLDRGNKSDFSKGLESGWKNFWRILGFNLLLMSAIIIFLAILIFPVVIMAVLQAYVFAVIFGILFFILFIILMLIVGLNYPYTLRMLVLEEKSVFETIRHSLHFVRDNLLEVIAVYLIVYVIGMAFSIVAIITIALAGIILFVIGYGFWLAAPIAGIIYGCLACLAFAVTIIIIGAAYSTFVQGVFTLSYLRLKR